MDESLVKKKEEKPEKKPNKKAQEVGVDYSDPDEFTAAMNRTFGLEDDNVHEMTMHMLC